MESVCEQILIHLDMPKVEIESENIRYNLSYAFKLTNVRSCRHVGTANESNEFVMALSLK